MAAVGCAVKNQIAVAFGEDVFEAITSSQAWSQETGEIETKCLKQSHAKSCSVGDASIWWAALLSDT
ncbi:hypothetical protein N7497_000863 [Penicillium chrysogenum]|nr:hypothetical protein N7497_000863 [Penicillium chrysogenum]